MDTIGSFTSEGTAPRSRTAYLAIAGGASIPGTHATGSDAVEGAIGGSRYRSYYPGGHQVVDKLDKPDQRNNLFTA